MWSYTALQDTTKVLPYDDEVKLIAVTSSKAIVAKVGKGNNLIEVITEAQPQDGAGGAEQDEENTENIALPSGNEENTQAATEAPSTQATTEQPVSAEGGE
jgi:hypothetical protein